MTTADAIGAQGRGFRAFAEPGEAFGFEEIRRDAAWSAARGRQVAALDVRGLGLRQATRLAEWQPSAGAAPAAGR